MSQTMYPSHDRELLSQVVSTPAFQNLMQIPKYPWQQIAIIAWVYGAFIISIPLYLNGIIPLWAAVILNFTSVYVSFTPFHDAAHSSASGDRRVNDLLGTISVLPLFPGFTTGLYRFLHLEHHRYTGEEGRDPDDILVTAHPIIRPVMWMFIDVYWIHWYIRRWKERSGSELIRDGIGAVFIIALHVGFLTSQWAFEFFMLWMVPQRLGMTALTYYFAAIQHPKGVVQAEHPIQGTRMIKGGTLTRYLSISQSQHLMHHLFPTVPYYRYNAAWKLSRQLLEKDNEIVWGNSIGKFIMPTSLDSKQKTAPTQKARVVAVEDVSSEVRAFTMSPLEEGSPLAPYSPGAHFDLHLSPTLVRQYSLCRAPQSGNSDYRIGIKREADGRGGSIAAHEQLKVGSEVEIGLPRNHFELDTSGSGRTLLLAGGIGITPLLSMAEALSAQGKKFTLHASARSQALMPFAEELKAADWASENLQFHFDDEADSKPVSAQDIGAWSQGDILYICGPVGFMDHISDMANNLGWPTEAVRTENFAAGTQDKSTHQPFQALLQKSGKQILVPADKSLLDVLQANKISDAVGVCTQGICGSCKVRVVSGKVEHHDAVLKPCEREAGYMTACVSRAQGDEKLVLDL